MRATCASSTGAQLRGAPAPRKVAMPEVSPRSVARLTARVRRLWNADAVPILATVTDVNGPYTEVVDYYSPSIRRALVASTEEGGETGTSATEADCGTRMIPARFVSLAEAIAEARRRGPTGRLNQAFLHYSRGTTGQSSLVWDLSFGRNFDAVRVGAYRTSRAELARLRSSA